MGNIARMNPKIPSKCRDVSWRSPPTPSSKSFSFQNDRPGPPPLNYIFSLSYSSISDKNNTKNEQNCPYLGSTLLWVAMFDLGLQINLAAKF